MSSGFFASEGPIVGLNTSGATQVSNSRPKKTATQRRSPRVSRPVGHPRINQKSSGRKTTAMSAPQAATKPCCGAAASHASHAAPSVSVTRPDGLEGRHHQRVNPHAGRTHIGTSKSHPAARS